MQVNEINRLSYNIAFSPDGSKLIFTQGNKLYFYDIISGEIIDKLTL